MNKIIFYLIAMCSLLFITACSVIMIPGGDSDIENDIPPIISQSSKINELYYEEEPNTTVYSGGVKIESFSKVWLKDSVLKMEDKISFYKGDELLYTEIVGQLYDYDNLDHRSYYIGPYPEQANLHTSNFENIGLPRDQTILWYSDRATLDLNNVQEGTHDEEECLIAEILKNNSGSTEVWISKVSGLPVKIVNNYHGNTSVREYHGFKIGEGAVPDSDLFISPDAIIF